MLEASDLMTVQEVAKKFGVSIATIHRWLKEGNIPGMRLPGTRKIYIKCSEIEKRFVNLGDEK